jgi:hypothetical protein
MGVKAISTFLPLEQGNSKDFIGYIQRIVRKEQTRLAERVLRKLILRCAWGRRNGCFGFEVTYTVITKSN